MGGCTQSAPMPRSRPCPRIRGNGRLLNAVRRPTIGQSVRGNTNGKSVSRRKGRAASAHWGVCAEFGLPKIQRESMTAFLAYNRKREQSLFNRQLVRSSRSSDTSDLTEYSEL